MATTEHHLLFEMAQTAPIGICILDANTLVSEMVNEKFLEVAGKPYEQIFGKFYWDAFPEARPYYEEALNNVVKTGEPYYADEVELPLIRHGKEEWVFVTFVYNPVKDETGKVNKVAIWVLENTLQVKSRKAVADLNEKLAAVNEEQTAANEELISSNEELVETQQQLRGINLDLQSKINQLSRNEQLLNRFITEAPAGLALMRGSDYIYTIHNAAYQAILPGRQLLGRSFFDAVAELKGTPIEQVLHDVYHKGITHSFSETLVPLSDYEGGPTVDRYFTLNYLPWLDDNGVVDGILNLAVEVTEAVNARKALFDSSDRFEVAIDAGNFGTTEVDLASGTMVYNDRFKEIFGRDKSENLTYQDMFEAMLPEYRDEVRRRSVKARDEHSLYEATYQIKWPDGSLHWIEAHGRGRYDKDGNPDRMVGILADVTDEVQAKRSLQNAYEQLRLSREAAQLGFFDMDMLAGTMEWDPRCRELFGISHTNTVTYEKDFLTGLHPDDKDRILEVIKNVFVKKISNGIYDVQYRTVGAEDRQVRWVRAKGQAYFDEADRPVRFIGSVLDITEQKIDEQRKNDFIGMVSHELKTPITSLNAYLQMLHGKAKKAGDDFTVKALEKSVIQIKKMTIMINGFLNVSRLESGKIHINLQKFDIALLIGEIKEELRLAIVSHQIEFLPCDETFVTADRDKIGNVINNLISNAVKYSPNGSTVYMECKKTLAGIRVSVKDQGVGVAASDIPQLFDRYYRTVTAANSSTSGFGIGLYLSAEIIAHHNGKIWVESDLGKGSTFYFSIPLHPLDFNS